MGGNSFSGGMDRFQVSNRREEVGSRWEEVGKRSGVRAGETGLGQEQNGNSPR